MPTPPLDDALAVQAAEAIQQHGTIQAAADALGLPWSTVKNRYQVWQRRNAGTRYPAPDGYRLKGFSTYLPATEDRPAQWVKAEADKERQEEVAREVLAAMAESIPRTKPAKAPKVTDADLANLYVITDFHLGMLAWGEEAGEDWDTDIAEELLVNWFAVTLEQAPKAETAIFAQLGDFMHWDGMEAVTPTNKHLLDADTRFQRLVRVAIRLLRRVIHMLLEKHKHVHVLMAEGNHDLASSIWLREWFSVLYENEPRISVDVNPSPYYCYEHGRTGLFFHHGHKRSPKNVDEVFASRFREMYGRMKQCYVHVGHRHFAHMIESNLMQVEQHPTLAPKDAHAAREGYEAKRFANCITYHKERGEIMRFGVSPQAVQDAA